MKRIKYVLIILIIILIVGIALLIKNIKEMEKENDSNIDISLALQRQEWLKTFNDSNKQQVLDAIFNGKWLDQTFPVSVVFWEKYPTKQNFNENFKDEESIGIIFSKYLKENEVIIGCGSVRYYYKIILNELDELGDLVFVKKVVVEFEEIDAPQSYGVLGKVFVRKDRKIDIENDNVYSLLKYIADPYAYNMSYDEFANYSQEVMPYSDDCKIIGQPNLDVVGIPNNAYWHGLDGFDDLDDGEESLSNSGFPFLIFDYGDFKIKYEVKYNINDEFLFDYIEFVEVKQ